MTTQTMVRTVGAVLLAASTAIAASPPDLIAAARPARESFAREGAPSLDNLINAFIQALSAKDLAALEKLRVTKSEYVDLIVPGTVAVDQPPRAVSEQPKEYYWSTLDTKSHYFTENLLEQFGGRPYKSHQLTFTRPTKRYAWYTAHGQVRLDLEAEDGTTYHLITGWVAEIDGRYKFIGFNSES